MNTHEMGKPRKAQEAPTSQGQMKGKNKGQKSQGASVLNAGVVCGVRLPRHSHTLSNLLHLPQVFKMKKVAWEATQNSMRGVRARNSDRKISPVAYSLS